MPQFGYLQGPLYSLAQCSRVSLGPRLSGEEKDLLLPISNCQETTNLYGDENSTAGNKVLDIRALNL